MEARLRGPVAIAALAVPLITGLAVLISGFGMAWDFLNYHYYDGYAAFNDRTYDIAPAGLHTYFNPTAEIPFYLGVTYLPMPVLAFLFGVVSGLNFPLVFFLSRKVLQGPHASLLALLCALFAVSSANFNLELNSVNHDNLVSLFFLAGLLPLFYVSDSSRRLLLLTVSGCLIGAGVGLKFTLAPFLVATGVFLPLLYHDRLPLRPMLSGVAAFAVAALAGLLITSGWWMLHLWRAFGDPLFPMFNSIFHSPYAAASSYADHRFLPHSALEWIAYPLYFTFDFGKAGVKVAEHDYRYLLAYVGFLLAGTLVLLRQLQRAPATAYTDALMEPASARFLIALTAAAYVLWEITFSVSRYLLPLDLLLPLVALAWMAILKWTSWRALLAWTLVFTLIALTTNVPGKIKTAWSPALMSVQAPPLPEGSLVVLAGTAPLSYLIPGFPPHVSFVRISLHDGFDDVAPGGITAVDSSALLAKKARDAIVHQKRRLYVLDSWVPSKEPFESNVVAATLKRLHLRPVSGTCVPVHALLRYKGQRFELCELNRM